MKLLLEKRLVARARAGNMRSLKRLIGEIVNRRMPGAAASDVELYAYEAQQTLRTWDAYDVIALMQEIIWSVVVNPPERGGYDPAKGSLQAISWTILRNRVRNLIRHERCLKRGAGAVHFDIDEERWPIEAPPERGEDGTLRSLAPDLDRVRESLVGPARFVMKLLIEGYNLREITDLLSSRNNRWTEHRVKMLIQNELRPVIKPLRSALKED